MPDPPPVGIVTRYVLENPWPLGGVLILIGAVIGWLALREGRLRRLRAAAAAIIAGAAVIVTGLAVTTSAEAAQITVRMFVDRVVEGDLVGAVDLLDDDVTLHIASASNIGQGYDTIVDGLSEFDSRYSIESNKITALKGFTETSDAATVHLACMTYATQGMGYPNATRWVVHVSRHDEADWKIDRLVFISLNGQAAPSNW